MPSNGLDVVVRLPCEKRSLLSVHDLEGEPVVCIMERPRKSLESLRVDCHAKMDRLGRYYQSSRVTPPASGIKIGDKNCPKNNAGRGWECDKDIPHRLDPRPGEKSPIHLMGSTAGLSCGETGVVCVA